MSTGRPQPSLSYLIAPIHKAALGVASGLVVGSLLALITLFHVLAAPNSAPPLELLGQYFYGYTVTGAGAAIGFAWGCMTGFVAGWFAAFVRNLVATIIVFALRTKAEMHQTADFLDHI